MSEGLEKARQDVIVEAKRFVRWHLQGTPSEVEECVGLLIDSVDHLLALERAESPHFFVAAPRPDSDERKEQG